MMTMMVVVAGILRFFLSSQFSSLFSSLRSNEDDFHLVRSNRSQLERFLNAAQISIEEQPVPHVVSVSL